MATVDSWFKAFAARHVERFPRSDWPPHDSGFWADFKSLLVLRGVTEPVAYEASELMFLEGSPPDHVDRHPQALMAKVPSARVRSGAPAEATEDQATALSGSRGCGGCGGAGIAYRDRRRSLGTLDSRGRPVLPRVALYCLCPYGRFLEKNHRTRAPDVRKRFLDLDDYPWLWSDEDPAWDDEAESRWSCLGPEDRDRWRALAAERLPCWRPGTRANLLLAKAWALDPGLVVDVPPPPVAPSPRRGPRRVSEVLQPPKDPDMASRNDPDVRPVTAPGPTTADDQDGEEAA